MHQGNGTASIFRDDPSVFTFSMLGAKNFPFRKETSDLEVELADGTGDDECLALLAPHLPTVVPGRTPDLVFYLAGADPYAGDRLGRLGLSVDGLRRRDEMACAACRTAGVPIVVVMSGGYAPDIEDIVTIHLNTVRAAAATAAPWRDGP